MSEDQSGEIYLKILLIGDAGIGAKTSLWKRYIHDIFYEDMKATIGVDFGVKDTVVDGVHFHLQIWGLFLFSIVIIFCCSCPVLIVFRYFWTRTLWTYEPNVLSRS